MFGCLSYWCVGGLEGFGLEATGISLPLIVACMHGGEGEVFAGADGLLAAQVAVAGELLSGRHHFGAEPIHKLSKGLNLAARRVAFLEVAHEADADGGEINAIAFHMASQQLLRPARPCFDLAIAGIDTVADYEVVGESVLHAALAVGPIIDGGVAVFDRAVVDDNPLPVIGAHADAGGVCADACEEVFGGKGGRHLEFLADADDIAGKFVGALKVGHAYAVGEGDAAERVTTLDDVDRARVGVGCISCIGRIGWDL